MAKNRVKAIPIQVLNLSMPRTGTTTLRLALEYLDIPCFHGKSLSMNVEYSDTWNRAFDAKFYGRGQPFDPSDWDQLFANCGAVADYPAVAFAEELLEVYPDAKVILVERDIESWYKSFNEVVISNAWHPLRFLIKIELFMAPIRVKIVGGSRLTMGESSMRWLKGWVGGSSINQMRERAKPAYRRYHEHLRNIVPKERLLEYQIESGWGPLCNFLGKPVPSVPFPKAYDTGEFQENAKARRREVMCAVIIDVLLFTTPFIIVTVAWMVSLLRAYIK